ncbi:MAG: DNA mismatch repair protein MutL [Phycisphaeraceae bacterium]|nr:DNA mismatch repair protein MutL [Phycisphaeraceae bacterium]
MTNSLILTARPSSRVISYDTLASPMNLIRKLSPLLVNQIAAGEVIERPASVVKELVENSLDAGATRVDIFVEDAGRRLIRISDDGRGIAREQLPLALAPHATSKISDPEDLEAIGTLGFRGEALASIASVSRLRLTSRATVDGAVQDTGWVIEASGDEVSAHAPAACAPGTTIEVRDLFFNTPVRRKFTRTAATEFGHIADTVLRTAMGRCDVAFRLQHEQRVHLDVPAGQDRRLRSVALLGADLDEALLETDSESPGRPPLSLWALAAVPSVARSTSKFQYVFLNGRPIRDRHVSHAVKEAYRGLMPHDRHPMAVVMLEIPPEAVDVNVHPTKSEVRFAEPNRVHGMVLTGLRRRLLAGDLTPEISVPGEPATDDDARGTFDPGTSGAPSGAGHRSPSPSGTGQGGDRGFADYLNTMPPAQKGFDFPSVAAAVGRDRDEPVRPEAQTGDAGRAETLRPRMLQVHHSYLVTEDEQGLLIVDQHALHERVMFEQLRDRVQGHDLESQRLLMPATLSASPARIARLEQMQPLLRRIGIDAQQMGPDTIAIHGFASFLFDRGVEPEPFVEELLDRAEQDDLCSEAATTPGASDEAALHRLLDMMACKAAVKAGDQLGEQELVQLMAQREQVERASNCPHGRPTSIRLTLRELEKQFKRT